MIDSGIPHAGQVLLDALNVERTSPMLPRNEDEWRDFSALVFKQRLAPLMYQRLGQGALEPVVPSLVRERLRVAYRKSAFRNLAIGRLLATVTRTLRDAGIASIALKGAYLAFFAYREPGLRPMRDLDLLVAPEDAVRAFDVLKVQGYKPIFDGSPQAYFVDRIHLPPLIGPDGVSIELHHRLTSPDMRARGFEENVWAGCIEKTVGGVAVSFPCAEDMLLHLCIHASFDHQLDLGPLALMDIAMLAEAGPVDWDGFLQRVSDGGWRRYALPPLHLARRHLAAKIPETVVAALEEGELDGSWMRNAEYLLFSDSKDHKVLDYGVQEILYAENRRVRLVKALEALFPPRTVIARHFPVRAESLWAYLYYPLRWLRLATGKLPALLAAHSGRPQSLHRLAQHRSAFVGWLKEKP